MVIDGDSINTVEPNPVFFHILQKQQLWNLENIHNMESWNASITCLELPRMAYHLSVAIAAIWGGFFVSRIQWQRSYSASEYTYRTLLGGFESSGGGKVHENDNDGPMGRI